MIASLIAISASLAGPSVTEVSACPMCKEANETDETNAVPRAYMYSILFMLCVPATIFTGFGVGFYRLSKSAASQREELENLVSSEQGSDPQVPHEE